LDEESNEAHKGSSSRIHGAEGLSFQFYPDSASLIGVSHVEQQYMLEMVEARGHADNVEKRNDLFSGLLDAARDELDPRAALNEEELMGGYSMSHRLEAWKM
jgi:hypothetical protein